MENKKQIKKIESIKEVSNAVRATSSNVEASSIPKKPVKPPKIEDKPFNEFISEHLIPGIKSSIEDKGTSVNHIKLVEGKHSCVPAEDDPSG